ncbi:T9SS type A sorting domain-containing protein [Aquimarina algiphila]|uniref:T9SS type A sorting domain-containing protein n=1 Tax=Aquimarina algiphila TaxID=2047982 RepID=A0A554VF66_9FLAO|nr:T9SS type A sorting domain-containing protein [Aquimarina algiphila]TSE05784.1 T9SS type A sorting domain-containing protein [Aquimarina algiphila]
MKKLACSIALCFLVNLGFSQFQHSFGTEKTEIGMSLDQLQEVEKGYLVGGYTSKNFLGSLEATLVKTDLDGNQIWSRIYGGKDYEYFNSVRQSTFFSPNNPVSYVAAGVTRSFGFGAGDAFLMGVDTNGSPIFSAVYGGKEFDIARCVQNVRAVTGQPGYIMVGETRSYTQAFPGANVYVALTDSFGNLLRATVIGGRGDQRGMWIEQTKDGGYIIAGSTTDYRCGVITSISNAPTDIFVIKLRPNLTIEWSRIIGYPDELDPTRAYRNAANCVKEDKNGNYVLTGYTTSFGLNNSQDAFLLFLDNGGNFLGMKTYGTERTESGYGLEITTSTSGNQLYTVVGQQVTSSRKAMMFQTDGGGNLLWARQYGDTKQETGMEMVTDDFDKGFAFTGYTTSLGAGGTEIYLVETTDTGKTGTSCEREIDLKEVKHEPCITRSAQQIFVDDYKKIDPEAIRTEYKEDRCKNPFGSKNEEEKTLGTKSNIPILFPNPVNNILTMSVDKGLVINQASIFDLQGKEIIQNINVNEKGKIIVSTEVLKPGMYIIKLRTETGEIHLKRFLKK